MTGWWDKGGDPMYLYKDPVSFSSIHSIKKSYQGMMAFLLGAFFILVTAVHFSINAAAATSGIPDVVREKRGTSGLMAFPRVGRSQMPYALAWDPYSFRGDGIPDYDYRATLFAYTDPSTLASSQLDPELKREGRLIPFPRVGRSEPKRNGGTTSGALWFGPRLGKRTYNIESLQHDTQPPSIFDILKMELAAEYSADAAAKNEALSSGEHNSPNSY